MPIKIVLVEDSETIQIAVKMVMRTEREYELLGLRTLEDLSVQIASLSPDLLIIDKSLFDQAPLQSWSQPVLFLVGGNATLPPPSPQQSYLHKPFDTQSFLRAVQTALASAQAPARVQAPLPPMQPLRPTTQPPRPMPEALAEFGLSKEELREMAKKIIEEVAWEVVPELAESIIREEIRRLTKE